ncbi:hypothetical protein [Rheinheimera maricola]|uniref:ASP external chaperone domain-containing protein n=1 Tax=Rheinheimera maricola TaxID=2793282 RepID=A0ABS7XE42_9GAMM|nr:hypothetical protein [Rheinheimera maricola]MBZ9613320.1 hypothetical protein [Rheinheimera maricola]
MKYKVSILATTLCLVMNTACAQDLKSELQQNTQSRVMEKPSMAVDANQAGKYGMYQLQPDLIAVPQSLADRSNSRKDIGNMTLVSRAANTDVDKMMEFRRNSVVRNNMTGEMGVVTGNISVLAKPGTSINNLLQQFDLKIVRSASSTGVYIVQPVNDAELVTLLEQIKASGMVSTARLDIMETKYTNQ